MRYFFNIILLFLLTSCRWSINENDSYLVYKNQTGNEYILKQDFFIKRSNYHEKFLLRSKLRNSDKNYRILPKDTRLRLIGKMFKWHIKYLSDGNVYYYYRILTGRFKGKLIAGYQPTNLKLVKAIKHPKDIPIIYTKDSHNKKKKFANYSNLNHVNDPALPPFKDRIILKSSDFGF